MAGETTITVIGNLTNDPELRFTPAGAAVANFTIASTPREFDRQNNAWKDGETLFLRASVWREQAENVAQSLVKGMRVIASGRLKSRSYETKEGEKRTVIELEIDEIGPSLKYAEARVQRTQRGNQQQGGNGNDYNAAQGGFGGGQQPPQGQGGQWGGQQQPPAQQGGQWGGQGGYAQGGNPQHQQGGPAAAQQQAQNQYATGGGFGGGQQQAQADDPWATPGVNNSAGWGTGVPANEPPF